ncbi:DUF4249 domain-containing protein [Paracrocinitomix mangrovi]|uniref:DUF4249 domain-containing protein n=1 Tax=Paracrocinitomix mangrovi TaxID=2862509 RepID=UPI001C8ECAE8|nr:DUF4249 domain-containing protein [Paracrocinitomix mangrovi]UKN02258.1 DUF4249 domain-containing protein [Paracrocinitomix mangrovi]
MNRGVLTVLLGTAFVSCVKEIEFNTEDVKTKIVVNSLFSNDSIWSIQLSNSKSILDTSKLKSIENAIVQVTEEQNNIITSFTHTGNGVYTSTNFTPSASSTYKLEVNVPNYNAITSRSDCPLPVEIIGIDSATTNFGNKPSLSVELSFNDSNETKNYYIVDVIGNIKKYNQETGDTVSYFERLQLSCSDPNIELVNSFETEGFGNVFNYILLSDTNFSSDIYKLKFNIINWSDLKDVDFQGYIRLISASEDYFLYKKSFAIYQEVQGNPFATPVQVYSNIENGLGIFAACSYSLWPINW